MTGIETVAAAAGEAIAKRAFREWLANKGSAKERDKELSELIAATFADRMVRRKLNRQIEEIVDAVEGRLRPLVEQEYQGLPSNDREAVMAEVTSVISSADLSDSALFDLNLNSEALAARIRVQNKDNARFLGEAGEQLFGVLLAESCDCFIRIIKQLPQLPGRATPEILTRLSGVGEQVSAILARLPLRTLDAPGGDEFDTEFERRYLEYLSVSLDQIELFGIPALSYRPRATLSVAYISVTMTRDIPERRELRIPGRLVRMNTDGDDSAQSASLRAEAALSKSSKTLVRGEAGSGKTTLLRWIAIMAARGTFTGPLKEWRGAVPFIIKLRSYPTGNLPRPENFLDDTASHLIGTMPQGWVHRLLQSGRAILLVDGVDELPEKRRRAARDWLHRLLDGYPNLKAVITSRPAAVQSRWLDAEGFSSLTIRPMTPSDIRELVRHWHAAIRGASDLPCSAEKLPEYEGVLLSRFEGNAHLRTLAATPLLAAMLCALNLDRMTHLPRNRIGIYDAILELLLERREAARNIPTFLELELDRHQKEHILRAVASYMSVSGRSELSRNVAENIVAETIKGMLRVDVTAERLLQYLLERSGVIREPVPGRIDFIHRTVQEYLTAAQLADNQDVDYLVSRAHLSQWRETVIMAAGKATSKIRTELLKALLSRAATEKRNKRNLRLVTAACLETVTDVSPELLREIQECLTKLLPPRSTVEAYSIATAGEEALRLLPSEITGLSSAQAAATVRVCWLINGQKALERLISYSGDLREPVKVELLNGWEYFAAEEYAKRVLAVVPRPLDIHLSSTRLLSAVKHAGQVNSITLIDVTANLDLRFLGDIPPVTSLTLWPKSVSFSDMLPLQPSLQSLTIGGEGVDVNQLLRLPNLKHLHLVSGRRSDIEFVRDLPTALEELGLGQLYDVNDYSPIGSLSSLKALELFNCRRLTDIGQIRTLKSLTNLGLSYAPLRSLNALVANLPNLKSLRLRVCEEITDIRPLSGLDQLVSLDLSGSSKVVDLASIGKFPKLAHLQIAKTTVANLSPLADCPNLLTLDISGCGKVQDVGVLNRSKSLRQLVLSADDAEPKGVSKLDDRIDVIRFSPGFHTN